MNTQNTKIQGYSTAQGDALYTNFKIARDAYGRLTGYAMLDMFDGRFMVTTNRRASIFEKQGDGEVLDFTEIYERYYI